MTIEVGQCKNVEVSKIKPSKFNARHDQEAIDSDDFLELCNSIREDGLIEPIVIRKIDDGKHTHEAIAGSRRLKALKYVGVKEAPTIIRHMNDNDVRIASLVENIHRKGLSDNEKEQQIKEIYTEDGWKDLDLVKKMLNHIQYQDEKQFRETSTKKVYKTEATENITEGFKTLARRIGYSPRYQINILGGEPERDFEDVNHLAELSDFKRELIEKRKELKDQDLQQIIASNILHKTDAKAEIIVSDYIQAIQEGEYYKDEDEGIWRWKPKEKKKRSRGTRSTKKTSATQTEKSALKARRDIMKNGKKLFALITGMEMSEHDVQYTEKQAISKYAQDRMTEICTQKLAIRELRVFQDIMIPLQIAIEKLLEKIEDAGTKE